MKRRAPIKSRLRLVIMQNGETLPGAREIAVKFNGSVGPYGQSSVLTQDLVEAAEELCKNDVDRRAKTKFGIAP